MGKTIAISNMKGGVGKTMTAMSLGAGLAMQGKRILCIDADSQHSLTTSFGQTEPGGLPATLSTVMSNIINEAGFDPAEGIIRHADGPDLLPADSTLAGLEISLAGLIGRETVLKQYIDMVCPFYDYIIMDCAPSLDLLTINALAAADEVIIPVIPRFLDVKGLELLLKAIARIRRQINPELRISGILLTMVDRRPHFTKDIISLVNEAYGSGVRIFGNYIPLSIRAPESSARGTSIFAHDPNGKVAAAYAALVREVIADAA